MIEGNGNGGKVEKIAQNALLTVAGRFAMLAVLPVMAFMANSTIEMGKTLISIQAENAASKTIAEARIEALKGIIETAVTDRYRGTDAIRDQRVFQIQLDEHKRRIDVLERQVSDSATRAR